jgi:hypothetical protein
MPGDREPLGMPSVLLISRSEMATLLRLIAAAGFLSTPSSNLRVSLAELRERAAGIEEG